LSLKRKVYLFSYTINGEVVSTEFSLADNGVDLYKNKVFYKKK
jgi:hypothetical protein